MMPESARGFGLSVVLLSVFRGRMMRGVDYERIVDARRGAKSAKEAQEAEDKLDKEEGLEEIQLTTDGEEFYEYVRATRNRWCSRQQHRSNRQAVCDGPESDHDRS